MSGQAGTPEQVIGSYHPVKSCHESIAAGLGVAKFPWFFNFGGNYIINRVEHKRCRGLCTIIILDSDIVRKS